MCRVIPTWRSTRDTAWYEKLSRYCRQFNKKNKEEFGMKILNTTAEAYRFDSELRSTKWKDAIAKEMGNLDRLHVFKYYPSDKEFPKDEGW